MTSHHTFHGPEDYERPTRASLPGDSSDAAWDTVGDELDAAQSPRQQELARRIYDRLAAGDDVDDIKDLIAEMALISTENSARYRSSTSRSGDSA